MKTKVAIYCRLSEEDKDRGSLDSASIENQKNMLYQYAQAENWEVFHIYSDDDYAGADRNRPAFLQLLEDAQEGKFQVILCKTQSRFTRELELVEKYIHGLFPQWGIRFVSVVDHGDSHNKGNKKSRQINGLINQWYLEDMSDNIRSVLLHRQRSGLHIGSFALYGYRKDPDRKGHLLADPEAAKVVQEIFTLFSQGMGKTAIARQLNLRGIPNPTEYKRQQGLRYQSPGGNSTLWKYPAISSMLRNEMYLGHMVQGRYGSVSYKSKKNRPRPQEEWIKVEHTHPPLISETLWNKVDSLLDSKAKPFTTGTVGLFARKAKCLYCGYAMRSSKNRGRHYLQCSQRHVAEDACQGSFIPVTELEACVLREFHRLCDLYLDKEYVLSKLSMETPLQEKKATLQSRSQQLENALAQFPKYRQAMYLDKLKGLISPEEYLAHSKALHAEETALSAELASCVQELNQLETSSQGTIEEQKLQRLESFLHPSSLNRALVEALIESVYIGKRHPKEKTVPLEIHWRV